MVVNPLTEAPALTTRNVSGFVDMPIELAINPGFQDDDENDIHELFIIGVPQGATLSAGINAGNGEVSATPWSWSG